MNKILLVIKREYWTRVRKRSFIVMTILTPVLFTGLIGGMVYIAMNDTEDQKVIGVIDDSGLFHNKLTDSEALKFVYLQDDLESAKENIRKGQRDGLLYIPEIDIDQPQNIQFLSENNPHFSVKSRIERLLEDELERIKMKQSGITEEDLNRLKSNVELSTYNLTEEGEQSSNTDITWITAYVSSLLIYFFLFLYGVQVMKGVIEEKNNRIVEVIISSIKPFQLMMGKILGIAAVGLTQFLMWVVLSSVLFTAAKALFGWDMSPDVAAVGADPAVAAESQSEMLQTLSSIDPGYVFYIITTFVVFFLGGYFLYAALFALVGSAVDSDSDSQQFMVPITIPLIVSIVALGIVLQEPDGSIAFWMSMFPLTSPVTMLGRIPFGVPGWQIALSIALLIAGFLCTTWIAGRIYRVGILMHGTKVNYKTLVKWFFQKN